MVLSVLSTSAPSRAAVHTSRPRPTDPPTVPFRPTFVRPTGPFSACPVDRPRRYRDDFGDPRYAGGFHRHQGIDVFARRGTPVRAPFAGKVRRSSSWAGGLAIRVDGARGFVYEAHLSAYGLAGRVRAGDIVGYVGNTGDAAGGETHDHFEWHPRRGRAVDPFAALVAACGRRRPVMAATLLRA